MYFVTQLIVQCLVWETDVARLVNKVEITVGLTQMLQLKFLWRRQKANTEIKKKKPLFYCDSFDFYVTTDLYFREYLNTYSQLGRIYKHKNM